MTAGTLPSAFHVSHTSSFSLLVQKSLHLIFPNLVMGMVPLWDLCVCCSCLTRRKSSCRPSLGKALNVDKSQGAWRAYISRAGELGAQCATRLGSETTGCCCLYVTGSCSGPTCPIFWHALAASQASVNKISDKVLLKH